MEKINIHVLRKGCFLILSMLAFTNMDGGITHTLTLSWVKVVVERCQHDIMPDECSFVDGDAALILELAAHVDEDPFANDGVLSAVGMERREHAYRLGNFAPP